MRAGEGGGRECVLRIPSVSERRLIGAVCRKGWSRIGTWTGTLKNPTKCLWRWEPDRTSNFFFSPPAHLCAVTYTNVCSFIGCNKRLPYDHNAPLPGVTSPWVYVENRSSVSPACRKRRVNLAVSRNNRKNSGSIPRNACVACETAMGVWQTDGQTTDKGIPMCRYASQATQKGWPRVGAWTGTLKNPTKCLWRWETRPYVQTSSVRLHIYVPSHL